MINLNESRSELWELTEGFLNGVLPKYQSNSHNPHGIAAKLQEARDNVILSAERAKQEYYKRDVDVSNIYGFMFNVKCELERLVFYANEKIDLIKRIGDRVYEIYEEQGRSEE